MPRGLQEMEVLENEREDTELGSLMDAIDVDAASSSAPPVHFLEEVEVTLTD